MKQQPKTAPKVKSPSKDKPNFMQERLAPTKGKSPMSPLSKKRLSK